MATWLCQNDLSDPDLLRQFIEELDGFQFDFFDNIQTRYFLDYRPGRVEKKDLDRAVNNLVYFKSLGLTESYDQYVNQFCELYGLQTTSTVARRNPSRVTALFDVTSPEIQEACQPLIQYDQQLYNHVLAGG